jgi:hypothetical protein
MKALGTCHGLWMGNNSYKPYWGLKIDKKQKSLQVISF